MKKFTIYIILISSLLCGCTGGDRMLAELERLEEQNRSDVPFTSDSAALRLVNYYDRWYRLPTTYNRNLSMRAYYMLGSAYRDMGEAPAALHYFDIAIQQVDTTDVDSANAATLFRIYGQMATIYGQQDMPIEKHDAILHYKRYALKAKDTLSYIIAYEHMTDVCYLLDDTLGVFAYTDSANTLYRQFGYRELAAGVFPPAIYLSLLSKDYVKAHKYMEIFEQESGLFDEEGNIEKGREHYYYSKGLYCIGTGDIEDAEYYFRKLSQYGYTYESYKGLLSVFNKCKNIDSIAKYVELTETALGKWMGNQQDRAIIQSSAMYRYERNQNIAMANAQKATRYKILIISGCIIALILFICIYCIFKRHSKKQEERIRKLDEAYQKTLKEYELLVDEYRILKDNYNHSNMSPEAKEMILEKQTRIEELEKEIKQYQLYLNTLKYTEREHLLIENDVTNYFITKKHITPNWKLPIEEKWRLLLKVYAQYMPIASTYMDRAELSRQERFTCILTHLNFMPGDIALLLNTSSSRISNAKKDACKKLFKDADSSQLRKRIIDMESK